MKNIFKVLGILLLSLAILPGCDIFKEDSKKKDEKFVLTEESPIFGTWDITMNVSIDGQNMTNDETFIISKKDEEIKILSFDDGSTFSEISFDGESFEFTLTQIFNSEITVVFVFEGIVSDSRISGTITVDGKDAGTFTMTKTSDNSTLSEKTISDYSISVDSDFADWDGVPAVITSEDDTSLPSNADIQEIKMSVDNTNLYVYIKVRGTLDVTDDIEYSLYLTNYDTAAGKPANDNVHIELEVYANDPDWNLNDIVGPNSSDNVDVSGNELQYFMPLSDLETAGLKTAFIIKVETLDENLDEDYEEFKVMTVFSLP